MGKFVDLTGQKFGRWTVVSKSEIKKDNRICWNCICDCGTERVVLGKNLKRGISLSCGCYNVDKVKEKWQDEEFRKMQSNKLKKMNEENWKDEEYRKKQSEKSSKTIKKQWQDEDFIKLQKEKGKKQWQDEEFRQKYIQSVSKGGISTISNYLRNLPIIREWRKNTYIRENSKCQLTGQYVHAGNSDVHHLKGFNFIVREAHIFNNITIKKSISDYTKAELQLLEDYIIKQHENTDNAVLLCDELHMLFHKPKKDGGYGKGNNTPEQFEEFKERYLAGEFKEILK